MIWAWCLTARYPGYLIFMSRPVGHHVSGTQPSERAPTPSPSTPWPWVSSSSPISSVINSFVKIFHFYLEDILSTLCTLFRSTQWRRCQPVLSAPVWDFPARRGPTCREVLYHHAHRHADLRHPPHLGRQEWRERPHAALDGSLVNSVCGSGLLWSLAHIRLLHLPGGNLRCSGGLWLDGLQHLLLVGGEESLQERQVVPESRYWGPSGVCQVILVSVNMSVFVFLHIDRLKNKIKINLSIDIKSVIKWNMYCQFPKSKSLLVF